MKICIIGLFSRLFQMVLPKNGNEELWKEVTWVQTFGRALCT